MLDAVYRLLSRGDYAAAAALLTARYDADELPALLAEAMSYVFKMGMEAA